jgi:hypothetical protein
MSQQRRRSGKRKHVMKLSLPPTLVEKLVWVPVISFCKIFIPSYTFDALLRRNWPFSPPNRLTLRITLLFDENLQSSIKQSTQTKGGEKATRWKDPILLASKKSSKKCRPLREQKQIKYSKSTLDKGEGRNTPKKHLA